MAKDTYVRDLLNDCAAAGRAGLEALGAKPVPGEHDGAEVGAKAAAGAGVYCDSEGCEAWCATPGCDPEQARATARAQGWDCRGDGEDFCPAHGAGEGAAFSPGLEDVRRGPREFFLVCRALGCAQDFDGASTDLAVIRERARVAGWTVDLMLGDLCPEHTAALRARERELSEAVAVVRESILSSAREVDESSAVESLARAAEVSAAVEKSLAVETSRGVVATGVGVPFTVVCDGEGCRAIFPPLGPWVHGFEPLTTEVQRRGWVWVGPLTLCPRCAAPGRRA